MRLSESEYDAIIARQSAVPAKTHKPAVDGATRNTQVAREFHLTAPKPPSTNTYWRFDRATGRVLISAAGRAYRRMIKQLVMAHQQRAMLPMKGRIAVDIVFYQSDRRRRDLDNMFKCILDSMQHAGVYPDDSAIDHLVISRETAESSSLSIYVRELSASK